MFCAPLIFRRSAHNLIPDSSVLEDGTNQSPHPIKLCMQNHLRHTNSHRNIILTNISFYIHFPLCVFVSISENTLQVITQYKHWILLTELAGCFSLCNHLQELKGKPIPFQGVFPADCILSVLKRK